MMVIIAVLAKSRKQRNWKLQEISANNGCKYSECRVYIGRWMSIIFVISFLEREIEVNIIRLLCV